MLSPSRARVLAGVLLAAAVGCATARMSARFPIRAMVDQPPAQLRAQVLEVGATAPPLELSTVGGGRWSLAQAHQAGPVVLVFYRGSW